MVRCCPKTTPDPVLQNVGWKRSVFDVTLAEYLLHRIVPAVLLASLAFCTVAATSSGWAQGAERPNVLLILVDDLKPALGGYGDPVAQTPHLDALAKRGMRFDLAYCNQAVCAPSRFTLMLGSHSTSTGLYGLGSQLRDVVPEAVTMPQYFARHGYRTESLGKVYHIGHGNYGDPASFCVPHFHDKVIEYLDPVSTGGGQLTREEALFTNQQLDRIRSLPRGAAFEWPVAEDDDYADGRVAAETVRRLEAAAQRRDRDATPFFIAAGFVRPHLPFSAPKRYWDRYDPATLPMPEFEELPADAPAVAGKRGGEMVAYAPVPENGPIPDPLKRQLIHGYYASTSYVDAQIGRLIDELDRLQLAEETIVVMWGDHGFHLGDLGIWTKHTNYEQANRIPLLVIAPGVTQPGSSTRQLAESVDIFPTLAELAGLPPPAVPQPIDGVSLVPILKSADARVRDHAYHVYPKQKLGRAIRTERYRLVQWKGIGESSESAEYELYDYQTDPLETKNLAAEHPEVASDLRKKLAAYPDPVAPQPRRRQTNASTSPQVAQRPLTMVAEVRSPQPQGVVLAHGGVEHGYALHFVEGRAAFDVRIGGQVTRVLAEQPVRGAIHLEASLDRDSISLTVNRDASIVRPSPGLIPVQPKDELSVGLDLLSAAGDYEPPNPFHGTIMSTRIDAGGRPPQVASAMSRKEIQAGLRTHDRALLVKDGWIRDPHIVLGPDDGFYLTGTTPHPGDPREQSEPYNTGLGDESIVGWQARIWRSFDLIDWQSLDAPFTLKEGVWFREHPERFAEVAETQWRLWAPELHWLGNRWALVHTSPSPVNGANLSLSAGPVLQGPWQNPMGVQIGRRHDPSLFQDDDGTWWLIWGATMIAPLKADFTGLASEPVAIGPTGETARMGHEGCLIQKIHGQYVLFGTGWSTGQMRRGSYNLYFATADKITGPYSQRRFVGRFLGHGTPFRDKQGRWWCTAFFNANVPPLSRDGIQTRDLSDTAQTINQRGTTIVPLEVRRNADGRLDIRAKDPAYATPGPDEAQKF
jgi:iduronate 2-sulfatase